MIGVVPGAEDEPSWRVYVRPSADGVWQSLKVAADGAVASKANYWFGWNGTRFASHNDAQRMAQHRPALLERVRDLLEAESVL